MKKEIKIHDLEFEEFISSERIQARIREMADQLNQDYKDADPIIVPVLSGAFLFAADLIRNMDVEPEIHFIKASSYGDDLKSSGKVKILLDVPVDLKDRHVLIMEDIVDSGLTCSFLCDYFGKQSPASVEIVSLLYKPANLKYPPVPKYVGFEIGPDFVVGYGLDYAQKGRDHDAIYILKD